MHSNPGTGLFFVEIGQVAGVLMREPYGQIFAVVYPFRALLANRASGADPVPDCVALAAAFPDPWHCCGRRACSGFFNHHASSPSLAKALRRLENQITGCNNWFANL
jgi:hypothetical protein